MRLSEEQIASLNRQGFLVLPDLFSGAEVDALRSRLPAVFADGHEGNIVERELQILGEPAYIQQVKVNVKAAFSGEVWQWHYDFATHHEEDGVLRPLALNLHVFLDDVSEFNGPLWFIPGSHAVGAHGAHLDTATTSYPLWVVDPPTVKALAEKNGMVSATGARGTGLIFFDTLLHGSPPNMSPWDRAIFSLILNPVSNAATLCGRPDYKHHQDFSPVVPLDDDCLGVM